MNDHKAPDCATDYYGGEALDQVSLGSPSAAGVQAPTDLTLCGVPRSGASNAEHAGACCLTEAAAVPMRPLANRMSSAI
jgi:hypothetical protein